MTRSPDPEREMVKRVAPYGLPAIVLALLVGGLAAGWNVGWSAAIGVAVVVVNALTNALLLSRAARISLTAYSAAIMGGFVVRLAIIVALMFGLNALDWFSPLAFALAVVPATLVLLGFEMKLFAGGIGRDLVIPPAPSSTEAKKEEQRVAQ